MNKKETIYDLEIEKIIGEINANKFKKILIQFPDGLKQYTKFVVDSVTEKINKNCEVFVYFGTCFGACDIPLYLKHRGFDLCIQFGHSQYIKKKEMW